MLKIKCILSLLLASIVLACSPEAFDEGSGTKESGWSGILRSWNFDANSPDLSIYYRRNGFPNEWLFVSTGSDQLGQKCKLLYSEKELWHYRDFLPNTKIKLEATFYFSGVPMQYKGMGDTQRKMWGSLFYQGSAHHPSDNADERTEFFPWNDDLWHDYYRQITHTATAAEWLKQTNNIGICLYVAARGAEVAFKSLHAKISEDF